jgi:PEP-CTERM motif
MRSRSLLPFALLLLPLGLQAQVGQVVGPNGVVQQGNPTNWRPDVQSGATAQVTTNNPRAGFGGYGSGSLELSLTGTPAQNGQYPDWGFYYRYAESPAGFGSLAQLSELSFDWFREGNVNSMNTSVSADWSYKTPVMRLVIEDANNQRTELIWEGYFNREAGMALNGGPTVLNQWQTTTNMQNGRFWFNRPPTAPGQQNLFVGTNCADNNFTFWQGGIPATTLGTLLGVDGCLRNAEARIVGIAVGVGSQWPHAYRGFVDNVRMGFNGQRVLDANFDFVPTSTVPEPSTYALMAVGLLALGAAARKRKHVS